jgi:hypothetical protein
MMNASVTGVEHLHLNMKMQFSYDIPTFDLCRCSAIQAGGESSDITIARSVMEFGVMWTWMRNARSGRRRGPAAARVPASSPARAAAAVAVVRAGSLAVRLRPPRVLHEPRAEGTGREMVGRVGSSAATVPRAAPRPGLVGIAGDSAARRRRRCCGHRRTWPRTVNGSTPRPRSSFLREAGGGQESRRTPPSTATAAPPVKLRLVSRFHIWISSSSQILMPAEIQHRSNPF